MAARGEFGEFAALEHYRLTGIEVKRRRLGRGSYATVLELEYKGLKCAGKRIFRILLKVGNQGAEDIAQRFENECDLLSQTRHPNIVQFLGVYFEENQDIPGEDDEDGEEHLRVPILVMEFLPTTLANCIDRYGVLLPEISYSILRDVALGLYYLHSHSPPIIHRDLSANNVLLTDSMTAKISDLGLARIVNLSPLQLTRLTSGVPGTPAYMPPEAFTANPTYGPSMDMFSFGIMLIHVFSGRWPLPLCEATRTDPLHRSQLIAVSEADRRNEYLDQIGCGHPLMGLILRCISNDPGLRGTAQEIVQRMEAMVQQFQPTYANRIEMLWQLRSEERKKQSLRTVNKRLVGEIGQLAIEIEDKQAEIGRKQAQIMDLERQKETEAAAKRAEICLKNQEMQQLRQEADRLASEIEDKQTEIRRKQAEHQAVIIDKNREIQHLTRDGQVVREEVAQLNDALQTSRRDAEQLGAAVTRKRVEIETQQAELERRRGEKKWLELAHSIEVEQLNLQLAVSNDQRDTATAQLQAVEEEKETYLTQNKEKEVEISELRSQKEAKVTDLSSQIERLQTEIANLRNQKEMKEAEIIVVQFQKEVEIKGLKHQKEEEIADLKRLKEAEIVELTRQKEVQMAEKEAEIADLQLQKEEEIARKEASVASLRNQKEVEIATKEAEIATKEEEIADLQRQKEFTITDLTRQKEVEIARQKAEIANVRSQKEAEIATKEAKITHLKQQRETEVSSKVAELSAKDRELTAKDATLKRKDSELASKNATLEHKSTAIRGLNDQLSRARGYLSSKLQPHLFHPQARITWKDCANLPVGMVLAQTVVIGDKVYVGGSHQVFSYSLSEDVWNSLPDCPVRWFGMGQLEGRVVATGGVRRSDNTLGRITNEVYVLDEDSQSWKDSIILPMTTPRHSPAVLSHHSSLIVAGGYTPSGRTSVVEIFRRDTSQWHRTCPLPFPCLDMSSVVIQNTAYLLGGRVGGSGLSEEYSNRVVYASVDSLLQKSLPPDQTSEDSDSVWKTLPNTPCYASAAATISGCLLAVGGADTSKYGSTPQKEVYIYSSSTASWLHVGDLPSPRRATTTAMISPTELLVIGGRDSSNTNSHSVFRASLEIH